MYLGKSMLGCLQPVGHSYLHIFLVSAEFIKRRVVFRPVDSVGSLARLLYDGSSKREVVFCL